MLDELTDHEIGLAPERPPVRTGLPPPRRPRRRSLLSSRRFWLGALVVAVGWAVWSAGVGRQQVVNTRGWPLFSQFWQAATRPELSADFLRLTADAALTTIAFAVLGTALSLVVGIVGGVLTSETWSQRSRFRVGTQSAGVRKRWLVGRLAWSLPRGIHEAIWGLFFLSVLGRDPIVGVLAIAIPFGAITAKVFAELIDESGKGPYDALRAIGAGRLAALGYGVLPQTLPDLVSYAFYRLECSVRSAVILGMIGAGGLGFQLDLSFQSLKYGEMWTLIYVLIVISAAADLWGAKLRRSGTPRMVKLSAWAGVVLIVVSAAQLRPDLGRLFTARTRALLGDILNSSWPPSPPADGWGGLAQRSLDTFSMSLLAIALASSLAVLVAFVAARSGVSRRRRLASAAARLTLLVTRAIPPPVWALLVLFILFPGPLPGAVALGVYNFGILGRLMSEVVENLDARPTAALKEAGASGLAVFAYATVPLSVTRFASYALYRWEVAARETVVVGVVGAGGLGLLLDQQRSAFNYSGMAATVLALIGISVLVDLISSAARRSLR